MGEQWHEIRIRGRKVWLAPATTEEAVNEFRFFKSLDCNARLYRRETDTRGNMIRRECLVGVTW